MLSYIFLLLRTILLGHLDNHGLWATLLVWVVRIITLSFLFRTYVGPSLLRLVSRRLQVRSMSLRSIRGIYFRSGSGTIRIDRMGISYHRPSPTAASRFSLVVEGLKVELSEDKERYLPPSFKRKRSTPVSRFGAHARTAVLVVSRATWHALDPYLRPFIRQLIVSALRFVIRTLPALTQVVDFELDSAVVTFVAIPGVELVLKQAKIKTKVSLTVCDNPAYPGTSPNSVPRQRHRRFASVADWNARVQSSLRRTWDRAWGSTHVAASLSLRLKGISATVSPLALKDMQMDTQTRTRCFINIPGTRFKASVRIDPHRAIEPHSVETLLNVDSLEVHTDIVQYLLSCLRGTRSSKPNCSVTRTVVKSPMFMSPLSPGPLSPGIGPFSPSRTPLSPGSGTFSPSPSSARRASIWASPMSPGSPFMEALSSASSRLGWGARQMPVRRLDARNISSRLAILNGIEVAVSKVILKYSLPKSERDVAQTFELTMHEMHIGAGLSHPDTSPLHRQHLGSRTVPNDKLSAEVYRLAFSTSGLTLDRFGSGAWADHLRLASVESLVVDSVASQWPGPWLKGPAFLSGDPNSQLLALNIDVGPVELTERLEVLRTMTARTKSLKAPEEMHTLFPAVVAPMPRATIGFKLGPVVARLISLSTDGDEAPFALEARTDGMSVSLDTQYLSLPDKRIGQISHDRVGLQMDATMACQLQRTFIGVCLGAGSGDENPRESLLSLDTIHITAHANALGDIADELHGTVTVGLPSAYTELQCSTEAISVELWQPDVIKAVSRIAASIVSTARPPSPPSRPRTLDQLPFGLSTSVAVGRVVLFVTAPDIAPTDDLGISRGVAVHLGARIAYCAVHSRHTDRIPNLRRRSQARLRLSLPTEHVMKAVAGTSAPVATWSTRALFGIALWDMAARGAVATRFSADDPHCLAEQDASLGAREFLRIRTIDVEGALTGLRPGGFLDTGRQDELVVTASASMIHGTLSLSQIYNILLTAKTLKSLVPPRAKASSPPATSPSMQVSLQCDIKQLQLVLLFPVQSKIYMRVSYLCCNVSTQKTAAVKWSKIVMAVNATTKQDGIQREEWEELISLSNWQVNLPILTQPLAIEVEADGARLRIPFDYVLADLILDINLSIKSAKHLSRMVSAGKFEMPPIPHAEPAKVLPKTLIKIRRLTVEGADEELESRLGLIWRTGFQAARLRHQREEAFEAKVSTIEASEVAYVHAPTREAESDFQFSSKHTVSVSEARQRLLQVHSVSWKSAYLKAQADQKLREQYHLRHVSGDRANLPVPVDLVAVNPSDQVPPLFRFTFDSLVLDLQSPPSLVGNVSDFLCDAGSGLPKDTEFSLLVPLHISFTVSSLRMTLREYPMPLLNVPPSSTSTPALVFDSDIIIAEEMGGSGSVDWITSEVVKAHTGIYGASPLVISIPKTIMPVKTYARPTMRVLTDGTTDFAWGISYSAATQDLMRVIDTLSHATKDRSPPIGFWDKLRLNFHWRIKVTFEREVHLHMKGSRDPYELTGVGAGIALCWRGSPRLLIGHPNDEGELIQLLSDTMLIVIPNIQDKWGAQPISVSVAAFSTSNPKGLREAKVCAKLSSGVRFGIGFVLERACGPECTTCTGKPFDRKCRLFKFRPHYNVRLETKSVVPEIKSAADSYNGFRSDFIHMSISLTSALHVKERSGPAASSVHLSPQVFEHFWAWYGLFDHAMSLPIRQGNQYTHKRPVSPKFGQHLATLKYRISIARLFLSHVYVDNSRDAWADGATPYVGVKALIDRFQADMHQRDQESTRITDDGPKIVHHKPFYAIEVAMKQLDLRSMLAVFSDPLKQQVQMDLSPLVSDYRSKVTTEPVPAESPWIDMDDFDDARWMPSTPPLVHLFRAAYCPQFTYFKRPIDPELAPQGTALERSKFGNEDTHLCYFGKEAAVTQVQIALTGARIKELQERLMQKANGPVNSGSLSVPQPITCADTAGDDAEDLRKKINLLNKYIFHLHKADVASNGQVSHGTHSYQMPSEAVSSDDWAQFDNVYQVHSPQIFMDHVVRDVMMQYYYCSRAKRGIEYHMATRAVKFIRDQARAVLANGLQDKEQPKGAVASAQAAAIAVRNFLIGDHASSHAGEDPQYPALDILGPIDPLDGWSHGVSLRKSHFCLLLKPQIVLRSASETDAGPDSVCILAAVQGKLSSFAILDNANADDPVSGKVMNRNFASVSGLQVFSPSATNMSGEGHVPLEVLIDLRCENNAFDRLVPQTDASFQYDKFNRLRLRNDVTSTAQTSQERDRQQDHLQNQTDLFRVHVPRFTVSANDKHFEAISNIVTNLILFSNAASKHRSDKLEKMVFSYDFTNFGSAADVVANMQARLRHAFETRRDAVRKLRGAGDEGQVEIYKIDVHILLLAEELNLTFDAIQMAQDKANEHSERKSALLLHASSSDISWRMIDRHDQLLAKLAVRDIHFYWLSRQDSSLVNTLVLGDLQAFDGSADAEWTEILSKHEEPSAHPLVKRKLFLSADWTVLPPVGGITIYERLEITLHPMRLQIDTRIGRRILEYVWPARRHRTDLDDELEPEAFNILMESPVAEEPMSIVIIPESPMSPRRSSWDVSPRRSEDPNKPSSPLRKLGTSRSFTDLRKARSDTLLPPTPALHKTRSTDGLLHEAHATREESKSGDKDRHLRAQKHKDVDDATEMKTRSSQKTFVWVRVNSLHLLLSIAKEDSFLCRDARIRTRDLEYRNQTSSFEELVDQFIPSGRNWRGWVKIAFQQPLVPVLPVARELISKTKWIKTSHVDPDHHRSSTPSLIPFHVRHNGAGSTPPSSSVSSSSTPTSESQTSAVDGDSRQTVEPKRRRTMSLFSLHKNRTPTPSLPSPTPPPPPPPPPPFAAPHLTSEPENMPEQNENVVEKHTRRPRVLSVFKRRHPAGGARNSVGSDVSNASASSRSSTQHARAESTTTDESYS